MAGLAVNVDHVATLRQARMGRYPDPATAAMMVELAGADGVVVHLREDRRHIQDRDVRVIREMVKTKLILEMAATDEMIGIALDVKPHLVTLVPESREEVTTEGGMDLAKNPAHIKDAITRLQEGGIPVSLFVDPHMETMRQAKELGADLVELHTGAFCDAEDEKEAARHMADIKDAAELAKSLGLGVNAGHGICHHTIKAFKGISAIDEYSIGHSIVSKAVFVGLDASIKEMARLVKEL